MLEAAVRGIASLPLLEAKLLQFKLKGALVCREAQQTDDDGVRENLNATGLRRPDFGVGADTWT